MAKKKTRKEKVVTSVKKNKGKALSWLVGAIMGLVLTKACNMIWPDPPVVVKEHTDKKDMLVRIIDNLPLGEYEVEAGFVLKEDMKIKFPSFNRKRFVFRK